MSQPIKMKKYQVILPPANQDVNDSSHNIQYNLPFLLEPINHSTICKLQGYQTTGKINKNGLLGKRTAKRRHKETVFPVTVPAHGNRFKPSPPAHFKPRSPAPCFNTRSPAPHFKTKIPLPPISNQDPPAPNFKPRSPRPLFQTKVLLPPVKVDDFISSPIFGFIFSNEASYNDTFHS